MFASMLLSAAPMRRIVVAGDSANNEEVAVNVSYIVGLVVLVILIILLLRVI